jgi:ribose transport system substrate-binding protein
MTFPLKNKNNGIFAMTIRLSQGLRAAVCTLAFAVSCATVASAQAADAGKPTPLKVGVSFQEINNPYFVTMKDALQDASNSLGAELLVTDARHDVSKQLSDIEDMLQKGIDILIINPTDSTGVQSAVKQAKDKGVVVVAVDAQADGPLDSFVGSKNFDAGVQACDYLAKNIGGKGDVGILDGIAVVPILERVRGCKEALGKFPGIKIVSVQNGKQERDQALSVTENMLQAQPNLKGLFSVNDNGSLGALAAIESSGMDVKLTSVDGAPDAIKEIQKPNSKFIATSAQYPRDQVRLALAIGLAKKWGAHVPAAIPVDVTLIDQAKAKTFSW